MGGAEKGSEALAGKQGAVDTVYFRAGKLPSVVVRTTTGGVLQASGPNPSFSPK